VQQYIRDRNGAHGIICKKTGIREKRKCLSFDPVPFVDRTDDVADNRTEHSFSFQFPMVMRVSLQKLSDAIFLFRQKN